MGGASGGRVDGVGLAELQQALASPDPATRAWAIAHARAGPGIDQTIVASLRDADAGVRRAAVQALERVRSAAAAAALAGIAASDPVPDVRRDAVAMLGRILESRLGRD